MVEKDQVREGECRLRVSLERSIAFFEFAGKKEIVGV